MNDEFIIFDDDNNSYQESYEPDDDITLEDVESYLESMRNDITDAIELRDNMIQEEYEYEDLSLEDVESYIESNIDVYNDGVDLYNTMIMESDDNLTDDFEEASWWSADEHELFRRKMALSRNKHRTPEQEDEYQKLKPKFNDLIKRTRERRSSDNHTDNHVTEYSLTDYRDNEIDLELDEPLTAYEFFDESYEPDDSPIIPRSTEEIEFAQEVTLVELGIISAAALAAIKVGHKLIDQLIVHRKFGRFPKDMKRLYDILESENFKASENKRALKKALRALSKDLVWMLGPGMYSRWKITPNEKTALKKLQKHVNDLYLNKFMLTRVESLSNKRRIPERLDELVQQGNKVLEMLNKTIYKNSPDVTTEWMV